MQGRPGHLPDRSRQPAVRQPQRRRSRSRAATRPKCVQDIRKALEDKDLDAISVATCNHWHSLITIWACQAGKDVYVEKPCSHNVFEGRKCVEAAQQVQPHRAARHAAARSGGGWQDGSRHRRRQVRQAAGLPRLLLQARAAASASRSPRTRRRSWTSTSGSARRPSSRTTRTWSTTTGTGSGTPATATSATRACTRWTWPAGRSPTPRCPRASSASAAASATKDQGQTPNTQIAVFDYGDDAADLRGPRPARPPAAWATTASSTTKAAGRADRDRHGRRTSRDPTGPRGPGERHLRQLHRLRPLAHARKTSTPTSSKATTRPPCATWPTSPTAWARRSRSTRQTKAFGDNKEAYETFARMQGAPRRTTA